MSFNPLDSEYNQSLKNEYYLFFDLGDVIIKTSKLKSFLKNKNAITEYLLKHGIPKSSHLKKRLFELIDYLTGLPRGTATNNNEQLPGVMCDWLTGKINSNKLVAKITDIDPNDNFFVSRTEGNLLIGIAKLLLPSAIIDIHKTTGGIKILQDCCKHAANKVCILSNWDKSSIPLLKEKFPKIFENISDHHIIFSSECGYKKPDPAIFKYAAAQLGIDAKQCILIDDQEENIKGAHSCGWKGIHHTSDSKTAKILTECYGFPCAA